MTTETKPKCKLTGTDGNIFALGGLASKALKRAGQREKATEMLEMKQGQNTGNNKFQQEVYLEKRYHHIAGVDFNHCEKGKCCNCDDLQQRKCEKELDNK